MTSVGERRRFCSYSGTGCQVNTNRQSNPPICGSPEFPKYWKVFQSITSMTGHTTAEGSSLILEERGEKCCWQGEAELWSKKIVHLKCQRFVLPSLLRELSYWARWGWNITALFSLAGVHCDTSVWLSKHKATLWRNTQREDSLNSPAEGFLTCGAAALTSLHDTRSDSPGRSAHLPWWLTPLATGPAPAPPSWWPGSDALSSNLRCSSPMAPSDELQEIKQVNI